MLLEPWFSNRTKSIVKSPKLYLADTGLLCALLNIRSEDALGLSPFAGAVWEADTVNLAFVRQAVGPALVTIGAVVCRTANSFVLARDFGALPVNDLGPAAGA